MRLFSYKMTHDSGFAPNPFFGVMTLATCKPKIRECKNIGDWIAGFTSGQMCGDNVGDEKLVYLMKVTRKMSMASYYSSQEFNSKIPDLSQEAFIYRSGDNIYKPLVGLPAKVNDFIQLKNPNHWDFANDRENMFNKAKDLGGKYVLVSNEYYYFGRRALKLPPEIRPDVPKGQSGHGQETKNSDKVSEFIKYIKNNYEVGIHGAPHKWPSNDTSWQLL